MEKRIHQIPKGTGEATGSDRAPPTGGCARQENSDVLWGVPWRGMRAFRKVVKAEWWRKAGRGETASMPQAHSQSHELLGRRNFKEKRRRADP